MFAPSPFQQAIFDFIQQPRGSAIIVAVAGSGKTTTLLEGLQYIPPEDPVWMLAFNRDIALELRERIKGLQLSQGRSYGNVSASTFHAIGHRAVCSYLGMKSIEPNAFKTSKLVRARLSFPQRRGYEHFIGTRRGPRWRMGSPWPG